MGAGRRAPRDLITTHMLTHKHIELFLKIVIEVGALGVIVLSILLVQEYKHVRRLDYIAAHGSLFEALRAKGPPSGRTMRAPRRPG